MITFLKLFHVIFVFSWIGTLLVLTRLLSYQAKGVSQIGPINKRIYFRVDLPSMILAVGSGIALLFLKGVDWKDGWIHMKLTFAFLLIVTDLACGWQIVKLSRKPTTGKGTGYIIFHAMAVFFLIMVLVSIYVLKP